VNVEALQVPPATKGRLPHPDCAGGGGGGSDDDTQVVVPADQRLFVHVISVLPNT
jgi:hypothetical protein